MPTISRFFGIVIFMNYNDHLPSPLPRSYQDHEVSVEIETGWCKEGCLSGSCEWL